MNLVSSTGTTSLRLTMIRPILNRLFGRLPGDSRLWRRFWGRRR